LLLAAADQPLLPAAHVRALSALARDALDDAPVASAYAGVAGIPALFPRSWFARLAALQGDRGAGALLRSCNVRTVAWEDGAYDVDTEADFTRLSLSRVP
jgi:CTP:molybdopterin cytidylyltransferase MocA